MPPAKRGRAKSTELTAKSGNGRRKDSQTAKRSSGKKYKLYAIDGNELTYLTDSEGLTGPIAVQKATERGDVQAGVPIVALSERAVGNPVEIEEYVPVRSRYRVKRSGTGVPKRTTTRRSTGRGKAQQEEPAPAPEETPAEQPSTSPVPGNPFAE